MRKGITYACTRSPKKPAPGEAYVIRANKELLMVTFENPDDIQKYIWSMTEIKLRIEVIDNILKGVKSTGQYPTDMECVALQFRKILELIALSSICTNKDAYSAKRENFYKDWNGKRILNDLEKVNPDFYPQPSKQIVDDKTGRVVRLEKIKEEYLTKELFIQLYDKCSEHLHSYNPYGEYPNLDELKADFLKCKDKIVNLLNHHQIQLVNRKKQLWVVMSTKDDGKVHVGEMVQTDL
jgi:hypothetical protein